jgi:hypothetical protein
MKGNNANLAKLLEGLSKALLAAMAALPAMSAANSKTERAAAKHKAWIEKCKNATKCKHCDRVHPNHTESQCWELEANAAKRPANWKFVKLS